VDEVSGFYLCDASLARIIGIAGLEVLSIRGQYSFASLKKGLSLNNLKTDGYGAFVRH